jgi:porphyrinogen peroxidase
MQAAEPQSVLTPLTEAAIFLVLTVDSGSEDEVRSLLADVSGLKRSVGGLARTVGSAVQMRADQ